MSWIADIAKNVVELVKIVPMKARIVFVGLIIILGFGLLYYMELHKFQIQMAQIERAQPQPNPGDQKSNGIRGFAGGIEVTNEKIAARGPN